MRDHGWSQRHMSNYIDGDLSSRQQRRLEAHARLCPTVADSGDR